MFSKSSSSFLLVALLLHLSLSAAARPLAGNLGTAEEEAATAAEDGCRDIGEEECLMRRTLAAHVDYIYTQKHPNP
ncbi:hypothetical protein M569_04882 [Genlisea aurea]|uniref:Phytosulfokine n=1 Tax=Genlisea aurea TaxID=192259 RepID=S8CY12_9LAMI|nr:hypothetical protein M569_04882 [Genlisea aurea]